MRTQKVSFLILSLTKVVFSSCMFLLVLVLRMWDVLLFEGNRVVLFRTAFALMELYGILLTLSVYIKCDTL